MQNISLQCGSWSLLYDLVQYLSPVSVNDVFPWIETQGIHKKPHSTLQPGIAFFMSGRPELGGKCYREQLLKIFDKAQNKVSVFPMPCREN